MMAPGRIAGIVDPTARSGGVPRARIPGVVIAAPPTPNMPDRPPAASPRARIPSAVQTSTVGSVPPTRHIVHYGSDVIGILWRYGSGTARVGGRSGRGGLAHR